MSNRIAQLNLPEIKRANHAHLGRDLEDLLSNTHEYYRVRRLAAIEKQPVEWRYTSKSQYDKFAHTGADFVARTNKGNYLIKVRSDVDFVGVTAGGRFVCFDAKQTKEKSLPLSNVSDHQVKNLFEKERLGAISGLMIYFSSLERLFFVSASVIDAAVIEMLYKKGRKSISLADCEAKGKEIEINGNLADWLKVLG